MTDVLSLSGTGDAIPASIDPEQAQPEKRTMPTMTTKVSMLAIAGTLLVLGGCTNKAEIESLRSEIASVRAIAEGADQKATAAQAEAQRASAEAEQATQEAQTASEKADRIFRTNLRK